MEFIYVGVTISSSMILYHKVEHKGVQISGKLRDTIWRNGYISKEGYLLFYSIRNAPTFLCTASKEGKVKKYKVVVSLVLTYAAEMWTDTNRTKQVLRTTKMNTLRMIAERFRLDKVQNEKMRTDYVIEDIVKFIETRHKEWNEHCWSCTLQSINKSDEGHQSCGKKRDW